MIRFTDNLRSALINKCVAYPLVQERATQLFYQLFNDAITEPVLKESHAFAFCEIARAGSGHRAAAGDKSVASR